MLSRYLERILIAAGFFAAWWLYDRAAASAHAADGTEGLSLLLAASPAKASVALIVATLLAAGVGAVIGALTQPLMGVFVFTGGLALVAGRGGSLDPWLRNVESSSAYFTLAGETAIWAAVMAVVLGLYSRLFNFRPLEKESPQALARGNGLQDFSGVLVVTVIGFILTAKLLQAVNSGQVVCGLIASFVVSAMVAHRLFPKSHPLGILLSPLLAALGGYLWIALFGGDGERMLGGYFQGRFWAVGLALPAHYASAGVAGAAIGLGWSQSLGHEASEAKAEEGESAKEIPAG